MIILIAESKTMTACDNEVPKEAYSMNKPIGENVAGVVMSEMARLMPGDLSQIAKWSQAMAQRARTLAYEFPNKTLGARAIEAYTGVVYRALGYPSLSDDGKKRLTNDVKIISSLYGWLDAENIIKAYRLDYSTPLAPGDKPMITYWKKDITIRLVKEIKARYGEPVLNLLPGDAAKGIDWKLTKSFAKVRKVDFKEVTNGGDFRTPASNKLKEMRGHLLREIAERGIDNVDELLTLSTNMLEPMGTPDYPDHIAFCVR